MFGLSRNALFAIGGVLLAGVLYLGFSGSDEADDKAAAAKHEKGKKSGKKKSGKKRKAAVASALGVGKICVKLDCSPEQLATFKALVKAHRAETAPNRRALREAHALIAAEYSEDALNEAALDEAFESMEDQRAGIDADARSVLATLHEDLTPEQRETLAKLVALHGPSKLLSRPAEDGGARASHGKAKGKKGKRKGRRKKRGKRDARPSAGAALERAAPRATPEMSDARRSAAGLEPIDRMKPTRAAAAPAEPKDAPAAPAAPADSDGG